MGDTTNVGWADHTFNSWMGCTNVSAGCDHCYAETLTKGRMGLDVWGPDAKRQVTSASYWRNPLKWNREAEALGQRQRVFCGSLMDWAEKHPIADATRPALWELIRRTPWLEWMMLTKRPARIPRCLPDDWGEEGYPNVWLGTSIESQEVAYRSNQLKSVPAAIHFISYEPALGPLDISLTDIEWLIYGGESGPGWRPEGEPNNPHLWAQNIRATCATYGTAFFFKQSAAPRTEMGIELDGEIVRNYPRGREPLGFENATLSMLL